MIKLRSVVLACAMAVGSLTAAHAQKVVHKPAAKPAAPQGLSLGQLSKIYVLEDLPSVDEYLTARNWQYIKSKTQDGYTEVVYTHKSAKGVIDSGLNVLFCDSIGNDYCTDRKVHNFEKRQHVYFLIYNTNKIVYDNIKSVVRESFSPSASRTSSTTITTIYDIKYYKAEFMVDNSSASTMYRVILRGKVDKGEAPASE